MFGFKIITQKKYKAMWTEAYESVKRAAEIQSLEELLKEKNEIIQRLKIINKQYTKENGCQIGPWCKDCIHHEIFDEKTIKLIQDGDFDDYSFSGIFVSAESHLYCKKHLHDLCTEWGKNFLK